MLVVSEGYRVEIFERMKCEKFRKEIGNRSLPSRKQFLRSVELFAAISGFIVSWTHGVKHDFGTCLDILKLMPHCYSTR